VYAPILYIRKVLSGGIMSLENNPEEFRTHSFYIRTFFSLLILFVVFSIYYFSIAINTFLFIVGAATILIFIHLTRQILGTKILYRILCMYLMIFTIVILNLETGYILRFIIILLLPVTFFTLLGRIEGLGWSLALLIPIMYIFVDHFNKTHYTFNKSLQINILMFLSTYFLILYISFREEIMFKLVLSLLEKKTAELEEVQKELAKLKQIDPKP
jgi:hypothetical protein